MSANLLNLFAKQFSSSFELLVQQMDSRFKGTISEGSYQGEGASAVDQYGDLQMQTPAGRFAPLNRQDVVVDRRWLFPTDKEAAALVDTFDKLKMVHEPESPTMTAILSASAREFDDRVISGIFGTNYTAKDGSTSTSFLAGNQIGVNYGSSANTGLKVTKIKKAIQLFLSHNVDLDREELYMPINSTAYLSLMNDIQTQDADFKEALGIEYRNGLLVRILGINVFHTERLPVDGSSYRRIPVYCKSGVHGGIWESPMVQVSQRDDLSSLPYQVYCKMSMAACRTQEKKLVEIKCAE